MGTVHSVERLDYRPALRVANRLAWASRFLGLPLTRIDCDSILAEARRKTGLEDWGDPAFLDPMARLAEEAGSCGITDLARVVLRGAFAKAVMNRLRIAEYVRQHPDVVDVPIDRPIFIVGFPRTGTTLLQNLLSLDAGFRPLLFWELMTPVPVHDDPEIDRRTRRRMAVWLLRAAYFAAPEQDEIHHVDLDSPEECWPLFYTAFSAMNFDLQSGLRGYGDWLLAQDMTRPYREYKRQLQIIAHRAPGRRFVLKCPEHMWFLDALLDVFPDASVVWTHRDPVDSVGSYCSLISLQRRLLFGRVDLEGIGRHITERFLLGVERGMAVRRRAGDERFTDVDFVRLVRDVPGQVRDLKARLGIPHGAFADKAVDRWLAQDRTDGKGAHKYSPERYGLDRDDIRRKFAGYIDRFDITIKQEAAAG